MIVLSLSITQCGTFIYTVALLGLFLAAQEAAVLRLSEGYIKTSATVEKRGDGHAALFDDQST